MRENERDGLTLVILKYHIITGERGWSPSDSCKKSWEQLRLCVCPISDLAAAELCLSGLQSFLLSDVDNSCLCERQAPRISNAAQGWQVSHWLHWVSSTTAPDIQGKYMGFFYYRHTSLAFATPMCFLLYAIIIFCKTFTKRNTEVSFAVVHSISNKMVFLGETPQRQ